MSAEEVIPPGVVNATPTPPAASGAGEAPPSTDQRPAKPKSSLFAFEAISAFVTDLWDMFKPKGTKKTPLTLYYRVFSVIKLADKEPIAKTITGFADFNASYGKLVADDNMAELPPTARIMFGDKSKTIYIDVYNFYKRADAETKVAMRNHLLLIQSRIDPSESNLQAFERLLNGDTGGIGGIMSDVAADLKDVMKDVPEGDMEAALDKMIETGALKKMFRRIKGAVSSGKVDASKAAGLLKSIAGKLV